MKTVLFTLALSVLSLRSVAADPTTFEEFKKLSANERQALFANMDNPLIDKFFMWGFRLDVGEESWQRRQLERLADAHGFTELDACFLHYEQLKHEYWSDVGRKEKAAVSAENLPAASMEWSKNYDLAESQYMEALRLYAVLAPSPQAQVLNSQAKDLLHNWLEQFPPGTAYTITEPQMATMERAVQQMVTRLKALPKLTPQEAQAAIERLPDDHMR